MKNKLSFALLFALLSSLFVCCSVDADIATNTNYIQLKDRECQPDTSVYIPGFPFNRFENEVLNYENKEKNSVDTLKHKIVFFGSSTMVFWASTLEKNFDSLPVIGHGFGGSTFTEMIHYAPRLAYKYQPKVLVIYCENDLFNPPSKSPRQVKDDICEFLTRANQALPQTKIVYLAMKHSIGRDFAWSKMNNINIYVKEMAQNVNYLTYVDLNSETTDVDGKLDSSMFLGDGIHLNAKAYEKWSAKLKPIIKDLFNN